MAIIRDAAGRHVASFVLTTSDEPLPPTGSEVGIDLGLTHFAVVSDGTTVVAPRFLRRAGRKLRRLQQDLCRKRKGWANRRKAVKKVARAHARVADTRRDWQHRLLELGNEVPAGQVRSAHRLVDAGVDVVHGHSSHHPRPAEVYRSP